MTIKKDLEKEFRKNNNRQLKRISLKLYDKLEKRNRKIIEELKKEVSKCQ